jgi:hypothetical protein
MRPSRLCRWVGVSEPGSSSGVVCGAAQTVVTHACSNLSMEKIGNDTGLERTHAKGRFSRKGLGRRTREEIGKVVEADTHPEAIP